jgi:hypothetical protein
MAVCVGAHVDGAVGDAVVVDLVDAERGADVLDVGGHVAGAVAVRGGAQALATRAGRVELVALHVLERRAVDRRRRTDPAMVDGQHVVVLERRSEPRSPQRIGGNVGDARAAVGHHDRAHRRAPSSMGREHKRDGDRRAARVGAVDRDGDRPAPRIGRGARGTFPEYGGRRGTRDPGERKQNDGDENCQATGHGAENYSAASTNDRASENVASS